LGTALRQGAASFLQIDPEELAMGIRPWIDPTHGWLSAEVYLYDTLPNGAGYAAEVAENIEAVFNRALEIVTECPENCETACYRCLLEYGNQGYHAFIDRHLALDLLRFVIDGELPTLSQEASTNSIQRLEPFALNSTLEIHTEGQSAFGVIQDRDVRRNIFIIPTHTFRELTQEAPERVTRLKYHPVFVSQFDLERRPFWVWDMLTPILQGQSDNTRLSD
jgi:hypothetical protein